MKYLLFLVAIACSTCFAQTVRLNVLSYDVSDSSTENRLKLYMDAKTGVQGAVRVFRLRGSDSLFLFKARAVNGLVRDTAYWYDNQGTLIRKTAFTPCGGSSYHFSLPHHGFTLSGCRHGEDITWKRSEGAYYKASVERYESGDQAGEQEYYYTDGSREEVYQMANGKRDGAYTSWFRNGGVHQEGQYSRGNKIGKWRYYSEEGIAEREDWYSPNDQLDSTYHYGSDGKLSKRMIHKGEDWHHYEYEDGRLSRTFHTNPYMNGPDTYYYPNGSKKEETIWRNGGREGFRSWYENGKPWQEFTYFDDARHGAYTSWYPTGRLKAKGTYRNGRKQGDWQHYAPDGKLLRAPTADMEAEETEQPTDEAFEMVAEESSGPVMTSINVPGPMYNPAKSDPFEGELKESFGLGFLEKMGAVDLSVAIDKRGVAEYTILTPMKKSRQDKLRAYLLAEFGGTWDRMHVGGRSYSCTLHVVLEVKDTAGSK